jgi:carbonic anhydrase
MLIFLQFAIFSVAHVIKSKSTVYLASVAEPEYSYDGPKGPSYWGDLKKEYILCKTGLQQSPIDINSNTLGNIVKIKKNTVKPTWPNLKSAELINEGLSIKLNINGTQKVVYNSNEYLMRNIHFHARSEHLIDGNSMPMEMHMVHLSKDNAVLVVGIFIQVEKVTNPFFRNLVDANLGKQVESSVTVYDIDFDSLIKSIGGLNEVYQYKGSFTTPPCTENVDWIISRAPVFMNYADMLKILNFLPKPTNSRPVQRK